VHHRGDPQPGRLHHDPLLPDELRRPGLEVEPVDDRIERDKEAGERVVTQASPQSKLA